MNHYSLIRYSLTTYTSFVCAPINSATVSRASAVRALLSAAFLPPGRMYSMKTLMNVFAPSSNSLELASDVYIAHTVDTPLRLMKSR